jgi:hypothetical protein
LKAYIPVHLIQFAVENKISQLFRSFIFLKYYSGNGIIEVDKKSRLRLSQILKINEKTFIRHLDNLFQIGWIGLDNYNKAYIRGWYQLSVRIGLTFNTRVEFRLDYMAKTQWQGYLMGSIVGRLVRLKQAFQYREGRKNGRSLQSRQLYFPFSCRLISNITNISKTRVNNYLQVAVSYKYLSLKSGELEPTKADPKFIYELEKQWHSGEPFPKAVKGKVYLKHPDKYFPLLHYKKGRF